MISRLFKVNLLLLTALLFSCGNKSKNSKPEQDSIVKEVKFQVEIGNIVANQSISSNYSICYYLPRTYDSLEHLATLIFFDSQGEALKQIEEYKSLSEKFGLILIGSNDSRNGLQEFDYERIATEITKIAKLKFKVDEGRVILAGFSGGARVTSSLAFKTPGISGVINCGAAMPVEYLKEVKFNYFTFCGDEDFNFQEMYEVNKEIVNLESPNLAFAYFNGIHQWPKATDFERSIHFMLVKTETRDSVKKLLIGNALEFEKTHKTSKPSIDKILDERDFLTRCKAYGDQESMTNLEKMKESKALIEATKKAEKIRIVELSSINSLDQNMVGQNNDWWQKTISEIELAKNKNGDNAIKLLNQRLLNHLSLTSYMYARRSLSEKNLVEASKFINIYLRVDPKNPEAYYLKAILLTKDGQNEQALGYIEQSIEKGFDDINRILNEPDFKQFSNTTNFQEIISKIK